MLRRTLAATITLLFAISACGDKDEPASLESVTLETLTAPAPTTEGEVCIRLSADEEIVLDSVSVHLDSATGETVANFSNLTVGPEVILECSDACICVDTSDLFVVLEANGATRSIDSGVTVQGCCESM